MHVLTIGSWLYVLLMNSVTFLLMDSDKKRAIKHQWRIPERRLLLLGVLGGGAGGLLAQRLCHHKTKKVRFYVAFMVGIVTASLIIYVA